MRHDEIEEINSAYREYNKDGEILEIKKRVKEALDELINITEELDVKSTFHRPFLNPIIEKLESIENYEHEGVKP